MADERNWRDRDRYRGRDWDRGYGRGDDQDWYGRGGQGRDEGGRYGRANEEWARAWRRDPEDYWREDRNTRRDWDERPDAYRRNYGGGYGEGYGGGYGGRDRWERDYGADRGYGRGGYAGRRDIAGGAPGGAWGFDESFGRDPGWYRGWDPVGTGRAGYAGYGQDRYGERDYYGNRSGRDRSWWDRASDEVSSWFGDEEAERRRQRDRGDTDYVHRGRGPRGYVRSDERIREDVSDRLTDNPILDASGIEVSVANGEVTLSGSVDSRYSKRLAEDIAEEVSGARHVQNNLRVRQTEMQRESISGTYSGIAEGGATSDTGRYPSTSGSPTREEGSQSTQGSGVSGSTGTGNSTGSITGSGANTRPGTANRTTIG
jgi:osmotically-inducible protein OsmY